MPLQAGDRLGPYEIIAPLGAGGMGEVYRARDTKLDREVAIKVLPAALAQDPERLARFEREAKVLASLNHPNIAQIYGVEERALVMELVPGQTLKGPLPLETALNYAKQIAEALEAAHEKGIIHRDLKPANIVVTPAGVVKVLDFGLAAVAPGSTSGVSDPANSPTTTMGATEAGVIMGTAAYMSPEQASGKPVDKRADIWSFGVVLWEMLTGHRLFRGETTSHTLADVLRSDIDFNKLPRETPARVRELLRRCLDRNVKTRLRDIGEARILIEGGIGPPAPQIAGRRIPYGWAAATLILALALAALAFVHFREKTPEPEITRFQILPPEKQRFGGIQSVSPDGRRIAYGTIDAAGHRRLWVRPIDKIEPSAIAEGDLAGIPFWSPDSRFIAYPEHGKLMKSNLSGGAPLVICDVSAYVGGGGWNRDGLILIDGTSGISRVSADGGVPIPVTVVDPKRFEEGHFYPSFLPDGRHFIFLRMSTRQEYGGIYVRSLDDKPEAPGKRLVPAQFGGAFVPSVRPGVGFLLFIRNSTLMAQRFDYDRLELTGEAAPISAGPAAFSASTRVLTYLAGLDSTQLTWYGRNGKVLADVGEPDRYTDLALSPDGTRVAYDRTDPATAKGDLWIFDLARGVSTRLTFHPGLDSHPVWSSDSARIAFRSDRDGAGNLYQKAANGAGEEEVLFQSTDEKRPYDWSSDDRFVMYSANIPRTSMFILPLVGDRRPVTYLANQFDNGQGAFSPDSRWVAYRSTESGANEIYVQAFPANSDRNGKWRVSSGGGFEPRWRKDGKELFYMSGRKLMAVEVTTTPTFETGVPKVLFEAPFWPGGGAISRHYSVTADGQRFLINASMEARGSSPITVVMNWATALDK